MKSATSGTMAFVIGKPWSAITATFVPSVTEATQDQNVRRRIETSREYMCPRFAQDFIWGAVNDDISPATCYSLLTELLPHPPQSKLENAIVNETICAVTSQHSFKV
jgi:hypothetical protein